MSASFLLVPPFSLEAHIYLFSEVRHCRYTASFFCAARLCTHVYMSQLLVYEYSEGNAVRITGVDAGLLSPDEIRRRSVAKITEPIIYDKNIPKIGGVNDHRLGVIDRKFRCGTCGGMVGKCQGHEGHIELPWPVFQVGQLDKILKVLRLVCFSCCRLLFDPKVPKFRAIIETTVHKERLSGLAQAAKTIRKCRFAPPPTTTNTHSSSSSSTGHAHHCDCPASGYKQPVYARTGLVITCDFKETLASATPDVLSEEDRKQLTQYPFTAREALDILQNISADDCRILGFDPTAAHPAWMIQTVMLVSSPVIRPAITETSGARTKGQDDLTKKTVDIVKAARNIEKWRASTKNSAQPTEDQVLLNDCPPPPPLLLEELQLHTSTLVNNEVRGAKQSVQRSGQPTKSISSRLKGKEGRVRGNLMGKRNDHSARNVISPEAAIDADELGVSEVTRQTLVYGAKVQRYNHELLTDCVRRGAHDTLGAHAIATHDKTMVYLELLDQDQRNAINLQYGWTVFRYIRDDDDIVFNRQPSLHRGSMLAFRVKSLPGTTTRVNLANVTTYNADFDGDEMNLHMPMSEMTRAEARVLLANTQHMITPQSHRPIIALVQDALLGAFLFTRKNVFLQRHQVMQLMMVIRHDVNGKNVRALPPPAILKPVPLWTGKQIFSLLFPRRLYVKRRVRDPKDPKDLFDPEERIVTIQGGELLTGALCKQTVGATQGSVVGIIFRDVSPQDAMNFVSDAQRLMHAWMMERGLSLGPDDVTCPPGSDHRIDELFEKFVTHVDTQLQPLQQSTALVGSSRQDVEQTILRLGNNALGVAGSIVATSTTVDANALLATSVCGSKGSKFNMTQIQGAVGQQNNEGKRIQPDIYGDRTLPCYQRGERGVKSLGYVCSNFERGLSPQELYFHAMSGRECLSDTAVKTSNIGYMQRRCMKSMESLKVEYDHTVRNADNAVVDFSYGSDNIDAIKGDRIRLKELDMSNAQLRQRLSFRHHAHQSSLSEHGDHHDDDDASVQQQEFERIVSLRDEIRAAKLAGSLMSGGKYDPLLYVSVNVPRFLQRWKPDATTTGVACNNSNNKKIPTPAEVLAQVDRLCARLDALTRRGSANASLLLVVRCTLTCRNVIERYNYDMDSLCELCDAIYTEYLTSFAHPGDGVGAIAAESIGEPTTQMTLNSVDYTEKIVLHWPKRQQVQVVSIGEYIDGRLRKDMGLAQDLGNEMLYLAQQQPEPSPSSPTSSPLGNDGHQEENEKETDSATTAASTNTNNIDNGEEVRVLSVDEDGKLHWCRITAWTRHLPQNQDGTDTLLRVTTASGRSVMATKAKSFLVRRNNKVVPIEGSHLRLGDHIPVNLVVPGNDGPVEDASAPVSFGDGYALAEQMWAARAAPAMTVSSFPARMLGANCFARHGFLVGAFCSSAAQPHVTFADDDLRITMRCADMDILHGIAWLLATFGIWSSFEKTMMTPTDDSQQHHLCIRNGASYTLLPMLLAACDLFAASSSAEQNALVAPLSPMMHREKDNDAHSHGTTANPAAGTLLLSSLSLPVRNEPPYATGPQDVIPHVNTKRAYGCFQRDRLKMLAQKVAAAGHLDDAASLQCATDSEVYFDAVVSIEQVRPTHRYVYDLSVEDTLNFALFSGIHVRDTFHFTGVMEKNVTLGVPRLQELIDATMKMKKPSMTVYLKSPFANTADGATVVRHAVEYLTLEHVVKASTIIQASDAPESDDEKFAISIDALFAQRTATATDNVHQQQQQHQSSNKKGSRKTASTTTTSSSASTTSQFVIRYALNKSVLMVRGLGPADVHAALSRALGGVEKARIVSSEHNMNDWFVRVSLRHVPEMVARIAGVTPTSGSEIERGIVQRVMSDLLEMCVIGGLPKIKKANVAPVTTHHTDASSGGGVGKSTEYVLYTEGTCLAHMLTMPAVDATRTISNDIHEVDTVLGVDAAADVLFQEIKQVLSFDGTYVQDRHILVCVHTMTWRGYFVPMNRHGMSRMQSGFLMQASFEETPDVINDADGFGMKDSMRGVTSNIMMGQAAPMGTCIFSVVTDTKTTFPTATATNTSSTPVVPLARSTSNQQNNKKTIAYSPNRKIAPSSGHHNNPARIATSSRSSSVASAHADTTSSVVDDDLSWIADSIALSDPSVPLTPVSVPLPADTISYDPTRPGAGIVPALPSGGGSNSSWRTKYAPSSPPPPRHRQSQQQSAIPPVPILDPDRMDSMIDALFKSCRQSTDHPQ